MADIKSFAAVADRHARVLVLGSMPGAASLDARQYYAHPRNAFWPIVAELCGFEPKAGYAQRLASLRAAGIALWDVLASCERQGSLDSDIAVDSMHINDFAEFLREHDRICAVLCNGATAHRLFVRNALPTLVGRDLAVSRLPSTSPAHASMAFEDKLRLWRNALAPHLR